jgi:hypothetical protein
VSIDPPAVRIVEPSVSQDSDPPATTGVVGSVRSSRTWVVVHGELDPVPSQDWNRTQVSAWALIVTDVPVVEPDQVTPRLLDVW